MGDVHVLFEGNDMVLEVSALRNEVSGGFLNNATVTVSLKTSAGVAVSGSSWPLALSYVAASDGAYRATLADTLELTPGSRYLAEIIADGGAGLRAKWVTDCVCRVRR